MTVIVCHGFKSLYIKFETFLYCVPAHSVIYYHSKGRRLVRPTVCFMDKQKKFI